MVTVQYVVLWWHEDKCLAFTFSSLETTASAHTLCGKGRANSSLFPIYSRAHGRLKEGIKLGVQCCYCLIWRWRVEINMREALHMPVLPKNDYILMRSIIATALLFKGPSGCVSISLFCMWILKDIHQKRVMEMSKSGRKKKNHHGCKEQKLFTLSWGFFWTHVINNKCTNWEM